MNGGSVRVCSESGQLPGIGSSESPATFGSALRATRALSCFAPAVEIRAKETAGARG